MPILRCTQKLLKELRTAPSQLVESVGALGSWHANLLRFERRKCVLFTNDATLYSVFVPGLRKSQFQCIVDVMGQALFRSLRLADFSEPQIAAIIREVDGSNELQIAKTNNRSVLGSMNDMAYQIESMVVSEGGLGMCSLDEINRQLNRIPMSAIRPHTYSVNALQSMLSASAT